jgi:hypothetical protein
MNFRPQAGDSYENSRAKQRASFLIAGSSYRQYQQTSAPPDTDCMDFLWTVRWLDKIGLSRHFCCFGGGAGSYRRIDGDSRLPPKSQETFD